MPICMFTKYNYYNIKRTAMHIELKQLQYKDFLDDIAKNVLQFI